MFDYGEERCWDGIFYFGKVTKMILVEKSEVGGFSTEGNLFGGCWKEAI